MTVVDLIRSNLHRPVRKLYIKRREENGDFEADWLRVDDYKLVNRVVNWGSVKLSVDDQEGRIGSFNASNLSLTLKNDDGLFNVETDDRSLWFGFLNRKLTKVKIEVGYQDKYENEVGVENIFEGVINKVKIGDDQLARLEVLSYHTILKKYDISDLTLTGTKLASEIIEAIMNQTKITNFISYEAPDLDVNPSVQDCAQLSGTYWDIIMTLAFQCNAVPKVYADRFQIISRTIIGTSVWVFNGKGSANSDIFKIVSFDDEGADRVRVLWTVKDSAVFARSSSALLLKKYLDEPENIDLSLIAAGDRQAVVNALLAEWENPKPVMEFQTKFLINQVKPMDIVSTTVEGEVVPSNTFIWGSFIWGGVDRGIGATGNGGGVIFHIDPIAGKIYEIARDDVEISTFAWIEGGDTQTTRVGTLDSIGAGESNTNAIVSMSEHTNSAAQRTLDYTSGGKDDWFLPSRLELRRVALLLSELPELNFQTFFVYYWTSSEPELSNDSAWTFTFSQEFGDYDESTFLKTNESGVTARAIRVENYNPTQTVWGRRIGAISIGLAELWKVTSVTKNINNWNNVIKMEKIA